VTKVCFYTPRLSIGRFPSFCFGFEETNFRSWPCIRHQLNV